MFRDFLRCPDYVIHIISQCAGSSALARPWPSPHAIAHGPPLLSPVVASCMSRGRLLGHVMLRVNDQGSVVTSASVPITPSARSKLSCMFRTMSAARDTYQVNDGPSSKRRRTGVASEPENDAENEGPACQSCRKRKAKCTRQQPCSNCLHINVDCIYDEKRKPGMRPGAIEGLNRRVATLEQMIIGQGILLKPLLERALQDPAPAVGTESLTDQLEKLKDDYLRMADSTNPAHPHPNPAVLKRPVSAPAASDPHGLSQDFINTIIDWYFLHIHPWIPILHVKIFRENLRNSQKRAQYDIISDAIVSLCLRFCPGDFSVSQQRSISTSLRHSVILRSMDKFSVESLQALVIISFDIVRFQLLSKESWLNLTM